VLRKISASRSQISRSGCAGFPRQLSVATSMLLYLRSSLSRVVERLPYRTMCRIVVPTGADLNRFHSPLLKLVDHFIGR
jgi:hypothetical protein